MTPWPAEFDLGAAPATDRVPTRQRLIAEGVRLFAERGFRATTVGDIEAAAGLQPRRGAMYRHFPSKEALLEAAVSRHIAAVTDGGERFLRLPPGEPHTEALALGRLVLAETEAQRTFVRILEREGDRISELRDLYRSRITDAAYRAMAEILRRWAGPGIREDVDLDAMSVLALGSLVNVTRSTSTFGAEPLGVEVERILPAWAEYCTALVDGIRHRPGP